MKSTVAIPKDSKSINHYCANDGHDNDGSDVSEEYYDYVEIDNGKRENARAWFLYNEQDPSDASQSQTGEPLTYIGLETSLEMVARELQTPQSTTTTRHKNIPDDGKNSDDDEKADSSSFVAVLGFSQGGVFGHILAHLACQQQQQKQPFGTLGAVILAGGFAAQHVPAAVTSTTKTTTDALSCEIEADNYEYYNLSGLANIRDASGAPETKIDLPSLHWIGQNDTSVHPHKSLDLAKAFANAQVLWHEKGHLVPQKSAQCAQYVAFLNQCQLQSPTK